MTMYKVLLGFTISVLTLCTTNAHAIETFQGSSYTFSTITQTTAEARAAWEASLASFVLDDLSGATQSNDGTNTTISSAFNTYVETGNGSTISAIGGQIYGDRDTSSNIPIQFDVIFGSLVNAVGFEVTDNDGGEMILQLTDSNSGALSTITFNSVDRSNITEFFGVVFEPTTFLSSLRISGTDPGGVTQWDNFTTGVGQNAVIDVPEPASLALLSIGLAGFGFASRRRVLKN